ncbi:PEP-CTERM sorting domain-containing protein [Limisphaera sp. VF-2]|jgi:hypothetical protein|uniref:PEP-CTERM sorting domain-containing protein n=1 Tax=Limisphaera sp. VF-2 TaxID=3400418 RepID=UPI0030A8A0F4
MKTRQGWMSGALAAAVVACLNGAYAVPLPYADGFNYAEGERLGGTTSGVNWTAGNSTGTGSATIASGASLTYPGLPSLGGLGVLSTGVPSSNRDRGVVIAPDINSLANWSDLGALYVSYLLRVDEGPTGNPRLLSAYRDSTGGGGGFTPSGGLFVGTDLKLGVAKVANNDIAWTADPLTSGQVYLVVWRYRYVDGADNDELALWVNPPAGSFGAAESSVPAPTVVTTTGADDVGINSFHFTVRSTGQAQYNGGGTYALDELRVGTTWASVVVPEPSAAALLGLGGLALWRLRRFRQG